MSGWSPCQYQTMLMRNVPPPFVWILRHHDIKTGTGFPVMKSIARNSITASPKERKGYTGSPDFWYHLVSHVVASNEFEA